MVYYILNTTYYLLKYMAAELKGKILVVEDDPSLAQILGSRLKRTGFEVFRAANGEEALQEIKANQPDLVLLDIILPGKFDGFNIMEQMRMDPAFQNYPVVIISNLGQEGDIARAKELGAMDYFVKAKTSIDDLVGIVEKIVTTQKRA